MNVARSTLGLRHEAAETSGTSVVHRTHGSTAAHVVSLILDSDGQVMATCAGADRLLASGQPLRLKGKRLCAEQQDEDARLQTAIARALSADEPIARIVLTTSPACSFQVTVSPLRSRTRAADGYSCLVSIEPVAPLQTPQANLLESVFGLSPAQARVAGGLLRGTTIREVALQLHVSVNTCKTHVKAIYAKTGCRSHADLVRRMMQLGAIGGSPNAEPTPEEPAPVTA
jgi:DNA-binding CsgD family transcriptional regulator